VEEAGVHFVYLHFLLLLVEKKMDGEREAKKQRERRRMDEKKQNAHPKGDPFSCEFSLARKNTFVFLWGASMFFSPSLFGYFFGFIFVLLF